MNHWLMKTEPEVFSIEDLQKKRRAGWDGVRNYQARNFMRAMKTGDLVLIYHSNAEPSGVAGIARVAKEAHPDPTQFDKKSDYYEPRATKDKPVWDQVEVEFVEKFPAVLPLERIRKEPALAEMPLVQRGTRLSVMPVSRDEWHAVLELTKS